MNRFANPVLHLIRLLFFARFSVILLSTILIVGFLSAVVPISVAHAGPRVIGNGSEPDVEAAEFVEFAKQVLLAMKKSKNSEFAQILAAGNELTVGSSGYIDESAVYYEVLEILMINKKDWNSLNDLKAKYTFIVYAIFISMGIEDRDFVRSKQIVEELNLKLLSTSFTDIH